MRIFILLTTLTVSISCSGNDEYQECKLSGFPDDSFIELKGISEGLGSKNNVTYIINKHSENPTFEYAEIISNEKLIVEAVNSTKNDYYHCRVRVYTSDAIVLYDATYVFKSGVLLNSDINYINLLEKHYANEEDDSDGTWVFYKSTKEIVSNNKKSITEDVKKYNLYRLPLKEESEGYKVVIWYNEELQKHFVFHNDSQHYISEKILMKDIFDESTFNVEYSSHIKN